MSLVRKTQLAFGEAEKSALSFELEKLSTIAAGSWETNTAPWHVEKPASKDKSWAP